MAKVARKHGRSDHVEKTQAGLRTVALPSWLVPELRHHVDTYADPGPDGRVFVGPYAVGVLGVPENTPEGVRHRFGGTSRRSGSGRSAYGRPRDSR